MTYPKQQQQQQQLQSHYEAHSSESYESAFFSETGSAYTTNLRQLVAKRLGWVAGQSKTRLLDIGGGTGNFTQLLLEGNEINAVVVDPFLEPTTTKTTTEKKRIQFVKAPAEEFMASRKTWWRQEPYHQILLKEMVHHIEESNRVSVFKGMYEGLAEEDDDSMPSILIITRPQMDIDYPFWDDARKVWAHHQPCREALIRDLKKAGFGWVETSVEAYLCRMPLSQWLDMVKVRCWSTFNHFTDAELERACEKITEEYANRIETDSDGTKIISFEDRLVFIEARRVRRD